VKIGDTNKKVRTESKNFFLDLPKLKSSIFTVQECGQNLCQNFSNKKTQSNRHQEGRA